MKNKVITGLLGFLVVLGMATPALADDKVNTTTINEDNAKGSVNSTLVTSNINSSFTMSIPATAAIVYGIEDSNIGNFSVYGNLTPQQSVNVTVSHEAFVNKNDKDATLPYTVTDGSGNELSNLTYDAQSIKDHLATPVHVRISKADWQVAHAGQYTGSITFTATLSNKN